MWRTQLPAAAAPPIPFTTTPPGGAGEHVPLALLLAWAMRGSPPSVGERILLLLLEIVDYSKTPLT